jgi:hypothetical protein
MSCWEAAGGALECFFLMAEVDVCAKRVADRVKIIHTPPEPNLIALAP